MIKSLQFSNVGVSNDMSVDFADRLTLITGDNGLGKSFMLDAAWWAVTRKWPAVVNPSVSGGQTARPLGSGGAVITYTARGKSGSVVEYTSKYDRKEGEWRGKPGRPLNGGLILYAMVDGSFAVWDPARNYWLTKGKEDVQDRVSAYVFDHRSIWYGLKGPDGTEKVLCRGAYEDMLTWQLEKGESWKLMQSVLDALSAPGEVLKMGKPCIIAPDDARQYPTLVTPYGSEVPLPFASAAVRRIVALAYCLVWAWQSHRKAAALIGEAPAQSITFLVDEIESHLHPRWQRAIVPSLMGVMKRLSVRKTNVQLLVTTHSPLVMASCEDIFDASQDKWIDFDLVGERVKTTRRPFEKCGTAEAWLQSEAFDLPTARSLNAEAAYQETQEWLNGKRHDSKTAKTLLKKLAKCFPAEDPELFHLRNRIEKALTK